MHAAAFVIAVFLAGCALLVKAVRWWRPGFPLRAALGYVALTAAFFAQPLFTGALQVATELAYDRLPFAEMAGKEAQLNHFRADTLFEQLPFHTLVRQRLLAGEAPLWSHELGTGEPLLGNGQAAPFAPLHVLALPLPPLRALSVASAWQILLGLLCTHALLLTLGAGPWGAALGAVGSGLSTYSVVWLYDTLGMAAAWVPGLLLGLLLVRDGAPRGFRGLTACALGLALSGHPETMAHAGIAAAVAAVALFMRPEPGRWRFLARLVAAASLSATLAAPALLPLLQTLPESVRGRALERDPTDFQPLPFEARFLLPVFSPLAMGSPPDGTYPFELEFPEICSDYSGLLVLALAVSGALALRGRWLFLLVGGLAALLAALRVPPFFELMLHLPVIGPGAHGRMREFWVLAVALAAGLALDRVAGQRALRRVAAVLIAIAGLGLALAPPAGGASWPWVWWVVTLLGAAVALTALLVPRLRPSFPPLVLAAVTLDLFLVGVRYHAAVPARFDLAPPPTIAYLQHQGRASAAPFRVSFEGFDLAPNLNALYGLWDPRGYDPARPDDAARLVAWWLAHRSHFYQNITDSLKKINQPARDYLAIRFLSTSHERELPPPWRLAFEGKGGKVWENPQALPLFFMPRTIVGFEQFRRARRAAMEVGEAGDFRAVGLTTEAQGVSSQDGRVSAIRPRSNGFDLQVETASGGLVVSSVSYTSGWEIGAGGRRLRVVEVNGGFLGFRLPPGSHSVSLSYRPWSWTLGLVLAAAGAVLGLLAGWGRRRGLRALSWLY
ncbi:MAG TPA: YfhO family protein [Thermoanaerobaculia bacterium]|nr:YfhO family protein [Thermoanaerobaculia bacterium]